MCVCHNPVKFNVQGLSVVPKMPNTIITLFPTISEFTFLLRDPLTKLSQTAVSATNYFANDPQISGVIKSTFSPSSPSSLCLGGAAYLLGY